MKRVVLFVLAAVLCCGVAMAEKATVLFSVDLHCDGCIKKIEKNIAFEKGVKDINCDLKKKTVLVTYDAAKTNVENLKTAFEKIGKPATVIAVNGKSEKTDAVSGASEVH